MHAFLTCWECKYSAMQFHFANRLTRKIVRRTLLSSLYQQHADTLFLEKERADVLQLDHPSLPPSQKKETHIQTGKPTFDKTNKLFPSFTSTPVTLAIKRHHNKLITPSRDKTASK